MDELVKKIVGKVFIAQPTLIEEIKDKGKNNLVFKIIVNNSAVILRLNNREQTFELFQKEKWCAEIAIIAGVPTPRIFETGILHGYAYSFQEFIVGSQGAETPEEFGNIWFTIGQYANMINKIPAPTMLVDYKKLVRDLFANNYFITTGIFSQELSSKIQNRLEETIRWQFSPTLCHGNLRINNAITDTTGLVHIIDWETATGNRAPHSELAEIYTWNNGKYNIARFIEGYGLTENEVRDMMRDIQTLVLLRLVSVIVRKMPKDNPWTHDSYIQEMSKMLAEINNYQKDILFTKNL